MSASRPRRSKRRSDLFEEDDEEAEFDPSQRQSQSSQSSSSRRRSSRAAAGTATTEEEEEDDEETMQFSFTQEAPDMSQSIGVVKDFERRNLNDMPEENQRKAILDTSRLLLFKALAGEPIDRSKCIKQAGISSDRISSAVWDAAAQNLQNVFGLELGLAPQHMAVCVNKTKLKERHYVVNKLNDFPNNQANAVVPHAVEIHSHHDGAATERAFLMLVLAFILCKGETQVLPGSGGCGDLVRWISDRDLYHLLHMVDEHLPDRPPIRTKTSSQASAAAAAAVSSDSSAPNPDLLLSKFVSMDYLLAQQQQEQDDADRQPDQQPSMMYAMGPRAVLEIGRKQVIYFCADILGQEPDPAMLAEVDRQEGKKQAVTGSQQQSTQSTR